MGKNLLKTQLVEYIKTGDEFLFNSEVFDELKRFILYKSNSWMKKGYSKEEIIEICLYKIGPGLKDFDPDRGEITTFIATMCKYAMLKDYETRNAKKRIGKRVIKSLNDVYYQKSHSSKPITYEDLCLIHYDEEYTGIDYKKYIYEACDNIKSKCENAPGKRIKYDLNKMFDLHYQGYTQREIGKICGVSQVQVSRMLKRIREEIIRLMEEDNIL